MDLISIVIPCYNYGWLLAETLDSVLAQTYSNWECIIIDDGSTDNTKLVAEGYEARDMRFCYVYQNNGGMSAARNHGLRLARGEYIQFLDADDLLVPSKLTTQVVYLHEHPDVDVVYGDVRYFRHGDQTVLSQSFDMNDTHWMMPLEGQGLAIVEQLIKQNQLVINAPLVRASLLNRVGSFSEKLRSMEDWELWLRCAMQGARFHYQHTPDNWALVRVHPTSTSQNRSRMVAFGRQVREQLEAPLRQLGAKQAVAINQAALAAIIVGQGIEQFQQGHRLAGARFFWQAARATGRYSYYLRSAIYWARAHRSTVGAPSG